MNRNPENPGILISGAVPEELAGLDAILEGRSEAVVGRRRVITGRLAGIPIRLIATGPGLVNTVQALTAAVEDRLPALLIQTGCGGAFQEAGLGVGDIAVAAEEIDVHLGLEPEIQNDPLESLPFPLMTLGETEIRHRYPLDGKWRTRTVSTLEAAFAGVCRVVEGPFVTVVTITATARRARRLHQRFGPCMEAMEGSGAACLALHYAIPLVEIRAASNRVGPRNRNEWNLDLAFRRCAEAVACLVRDIAENGWEPNRPIRKG